jgi:two-component system response regulator YesN
MLKAIIVDDEKWARSIIRTFGQWEKLGIAIVGEAEDGVEGLDLIDKLAPDIIITDMEMSNMDGIRFLKSIKEKSMDSKIIVISGHDSFAYMKQAIHSQAVEYILKPIDADELNQALEKCIKELALTKNISTLALHDLFDQDVIEEIIDVTKSFRSILRGTDSLKVMPLLSKLKRKFRNIHQDQNVLVRLIHDYFVPIIRDEMMDALKNSMMFQTYFEQLRSDVTRGLILEEYFQRIEKLIIPC